MIKQFLCTEINPMQRLCENVVQKDVSIETALYVWQMATCYEAEQLKVENYNFEDSGLSFITENV